MTFRSVLMLAVEIASGGFHRHCALVSYNGPLLLLLAELSTQYSCIDSPAERFHPLSCAESGRHF